MAVEMTSLKCVRLLRRGKVRDIYDLGNRLLLVATDRVSAFDCVLPTPIPDKGRVLTQLSKFWFGISEDLVPNHFISTEIEDFPPEIRRESAALEGRSMLVERAAPVEVECVVRGYICGSGWKEYRESGTVAGEMLPPDLVKFEGLPEPLFTPAVKHHTGHDENISFRQLIDRVGRDLAMRLRDVSVALYRRGAAHCAERSFILADAKFEFEWRDEDLLLIDEVLTPDSSRFWAAASYRPGQEPDSADKQIVRDYLVSSGWEPGSPLPSLPEEVVASVRHRYIDIYRSIVGEDLL